MKRNGICTLTITCYGFADVTVTCKPLALQTGALWKADPLPTTRPSARSQCGWLRHIIILKIAPRLPRCHNNVYRVFIFFVRWRELTRPRVFYAQENAKSVSLVEPGSSLDWDVSVTSSTIRFSAYNAETKENARETKLMRSSLLYFAAYDALEAAHHIEWKRLAEQFDGLKKLGGCGFQRNYRSASLPKISPGRFQGCVWRLPWNGCFLFCPFAARLWSMVGVEIMKNVVYLQGIKTDL